jgi:hypothetical protein
MSTRAPDAERFRDAKVIGRLDASKGVPKLVEHRLRYRATRPQGLDLVLVGDGSVEIPSRNGFHALGGVRHRLPVAVREPFLRAA